MPCSMKKKEYYYAAKKKFEKYVDICESIKMFNWEKCLSFGYEINDDCPTLTFAFNVFTIIFFFFWLAQSVHFCWKFENVWFSKLIESNKHDSM